MRNIILLSAVSLLLAGCASTKGQVAGEPAKKVEAPTYHEKVSAVNLNEFKTATVCPPDGRYEGADWRKLVGYANACVKAKDWRKVEMLGNTLATTAHLTPWGAYYLSLSAQNRKDYPRAAWMLELALKKAPQEGLFHYQMGRLQWEMGDDLAAIKSMKMASDLNASLTDAHYVTGHLALQKDDKSEAEKRLKKALANDPNHHSATLAMASLYMKKQDWEKAEEMLVSAVRGNPRSSRARIALAQVREQHLKKLSEALSSYKELRTLAGQRKLDEPVTMNLDEKIMTLEKNISQVSKDKKVSERQPSSEGKVSQ